MIRSPLFYPLNRGMDAEAGGVADLQTDVMRFIAILALCLVAIFALVQSIPLMPPVQQIETKQAPQAVEIVEQTIVAEPSPQKREQEPLVITRPAPKRIAVNRTPRRIIEQTVETVEEPVLAEPVQQTPAVPAPVQSEGFTLRFETDLALTRLVARNEVGLYAILPQKSLRMNINRGEMSFWPASVPNEFHEMEASTVPNAVIDALQRSNGHRAQALQWGVTIPPGTARQLDRYLREASGGALIIDADGDLRLER